MLVVCSTGEYHSVDDSVLSRSGLLFALTEWKAYRTTSERYIRQHFKYILRALNNLKASFFLIGLCVQNIGSYVRLMLYLECRQLTCQLQTVAYVTADIVQLRPSQFHL